MSYLKNRFQIYSFGENIYSFLILVLYDCVIFKYHARDFRVSEIFLFVAQTLISFICLFILLKTFVTKFQIYNWYIFINCECDLQQNECDLQLRMRSSIEQNSMQKRSYRMIHSFILKILLIS